MKLLQNFNCQREHGQQSDKINRYYAWFFFIRCTNCSPSIPSSLLVPEMSFLAVALSSRWARCLGWPGPSQHQVEASLLAPHPHCSGATEINTHTHKHTSLTWNKWRQNTGDFESSDIKYLFIALFLIWILFVSLLVGIKGSSVYCV